jgi:hypothetical protein
MKTNNQFVMADPRVRPPVLPVPDVLSVLFQETQSTLQTLKQKKHHQAKSYYQKHYNQDTFRPTYYEELKDDYQKLETVEEFLNTLSAESPLIFVVMECLQSARHHRNNGQPLEYIQLWLPLIHEVKNLSNAIFFNLLNTKTH